MAQVKMTVLQTVLRGKKALKVEEKHLNHTFHFTSPNHPLSALPHFMLKKLYWLCTHL